MFKVYEYDLIWHKLETFVGSCPSLEVAREVAKKTATYWANSPKEKPSAYTVKSLATKFEPSILYIIDESDYGAIILEEKDEQELPA
jgi:hypothetical protein